MIHVYNNPNISLSSNNTASLRAYVYNGFSEYRVIQDFNGQSVLNGFSATGGLSTFLSSIIAWLFGHSIIRILFGMTPLYSSIISNDFLSRLETSEYLWPFAFVWQRSNPKGISWTLSMSALWSEGRTYEQGAFVPHSWSSCWYQFARLDSSNRGCWKQCWARAGVKIWVLYKVSHRSASRCVLLNITEF